MERKVNIVRGCVNNGIFIPYEETRKSLNYNEVEEYIRLTREDAYDYLENLGGKAHMFADHYVYAVKLFGPRGGLREVRFITHGKDMSEDDFEKFIKPYAWVGAYHR